MNRALRAATMGVLLLSPVALSACSAGQVTQTATQERDKSGAQAQVGDITLREGQLVSPRGGSYDRGDDAELQLAIVNGGTEDDTLVSVDGKGFSSAEISSGSSSSASPSFGSSGSAGSSSSAAPTSSSAAASTPTSSTPTPTAPTSSAPTSSAPTSSSSGVQEITIPAGQTIFLGGDQYSVTLTDLSESLTPGQYLEVTLTFEKAGEVTIPVSVANPTSSVPRRSSFDFHQEEGGSGNAARSSESANK
ncbi:MAG: copper chaperone PCu(A)C [Blastococcus sp.]